MHQITAEMRACIEECLRCHSSCLGMASTHCLELGGKHVEPEHFRLMLACAEMCRTSAAMMLIATPHHKATCRDCAAICAECAASCEQVGDMADCVEACHRCAEKLPAHGGLKS